MGNSELDLHHRKRGNAPDDTGRNVDHRPDPGAFGHDDEGFILGRTAEVDEDHDWAAVSQTGGAVHHPEPMTARQDWTRPSGTDKPEDHPASQTEGRTRVRPNPAVLAFLTRKAGSRVLLTAVNVGLRTVRSIRRRLPI